VAVAVLLAGPGPIHRSFAQDAKPDLTSKVPSYTFANTLEEQERQLQTNPLLLRFHASRKKLESDPHRRALSTTPTDSVSGKGAGTSSIRHILRKTPASTGATQSATT
jgi:hypothetical protein